MFTTIDDIRSSIYRLEVIQGNTEVYCTSALTAVQRRSRLRKMRSSIYIDGMSVFLDLASKF